MRLSSLATSVSCRRPDYETIRFTYLVRLLLSYFMFFSHLYKRNNVALDQRTIKPHHFWGSVLLTEIITITFSYKKLTNIEKHLP